MSTDDLRRYLNDEDYAPKMQMFINLLSSIAAEIAIQKRWGYSGNDGELIALIHSEASEMLGALREGNNPSSVIPKFTSAEEKAADIVIRVFHFCSVKQWDLGGAILAKMRYNLTRRYRHGGKAF